ncbi:uncharacterized protein NPIL_384602 [Nephila pilipes]|uniref:Uncharacterized protein n=1 Tax=Nephila pilipes TaxID=299642 RepID=A0A8X6QNI7_NEPPI|nr:uncharacterized protein NPIL_384602 [Nephila pilipes]
MALMPGVEVLRRSDEESSSINLMRSFIMQSIAKNRENPGEKCHRGELSSPSQRNAEIHFLKKRCSSFDSQKSPIEETKSDQSKLSTRDLTSTEKSEEKKTFDASLLNGLVESGSFESSIELLKEKQSHLELKDTYEKTVNVKELKNSNKNSFKLACRNLNDGIFEDCSTYDINVPSFSPEIRADNGNEVFTNSTALSESLPSDLDNFSLGSYSTIDSEFSFSSSIQSDGAQEDLPALCDTVFTKIIKGAQDQSSNNDKHKLNSNIPVTESASRRNSQTPKKDEVKQDGETTDAPTQERRNSRRIRKRIRKSQSKNPLVYECPKCGVSYIIASKSSEEARCLHCDLWQSVEPEFMKREKLTWNTCRIC